MPFFSIIIPVYNVAPYLRECLDSVLAQTFTDWEAICVDDGSTDGSSAILDEYAARDPRFRIIHQPNAGVSAARNAALDVAKGEWVSFLDADDFLLSGALSTYRNIIGNVRDADAIIFPDLIRFTVICPTEAKGSGAIRVFSDKRVTGEGFWGDEACRGYCFLRVLRREHYEGIRFPVGVGIMEDEFFLIDIAAIPSKWVFADSLQYCYRVREGSASFDVSFRRCEEVVTVVRDLYRFAYKRLNPTRNSIGLFTKSVSPVFNYYYRKMIFEADILQACRCAREYLEIERLAECSLVDLFMKLRTYAVARFETRKVFRIIRLVEYLFYGIKHKCVMLISSKNVG